MAKKDTINYFDSLATLATFPEKSAAMLTKIVNGYDPQKVGEMIDDMHAIEHSADEAHHEMINHLAQEFITPIERDDIASLAHRIDDVTDSVEEIVVNLYMYNVESLRDEIHEFCRIICDCTKQMQAMMQSFKHFRKSKTIHSAIVEINRLEEEGDRLHMQAIRRLMTDGSDPHEVLKWSKMFNTMEACCDSCESVSVLVQGVIMKNS